MATGVTGHLLRIKGDVDQTTAIALFLAGVVAIFACWWFFTYNTAERIRVVSVVGEDGRVALSDPLGPDPEVTFAAGELPLPPELEGLSSLFPAKSAEPKPDEYRADADAVQVNPALVGFMLTVEYTVGHEPVVSPFVVPGPGAVLTAFVTNLTGGAFEIRCPNGECPSKAADARVALGAGAGEALLAYRTADADAAAPGITCPQCDAPLDGEIVLPLPSYEFRKGLAASVRRTALGFLVAVAICLPLGVLAGAFPPVKRFISPVELAGGYIPPVVLLPLGTAAIGVLASSGVEAQLSGELARIGFLVVFTSVWLYALVCKEVEAVDEVYVNTAYTLGATRWQVISKVLVPVAMANIWQHMRVTYSIGWALIILSEAFMGAKSEGDYGIGFFMVMMQRRNIMDNYFAAGVAIVLTGVVFDYVFKLLGRKLFPYEEAQ